jgi:RHS repeat-associated protein
MRYEYDDQGRLASVVIGGPVARAFQWTYDDGLGLVSVRNPLGDVARVQYDAGGMPNWYAAGDGAAVSLRMDGLGRLASVAPPGHAAYRLRRSSSGIVTTLELPVPEDANASAPISRSLDADGQVTYYGGPAGSAAALSYDEAGRLTSVESGDRVVTATYEGATTRLHSLSGPAGQSVVYRWDGPLLVAEIWNGPVAGSVQRSFDNAFHIVRQTVNDAMAVTFAYDDRARTVSVGDLTLEYGPLERPVEARIGELVETWEYDANGLPTAARVTIGERAIYDEVDERDALGRVTRQTTRLEGATVDARFGFDEGGRLTSVEQGADTIRYAYDLAGNRVTTTGESGSATSTFDGLDRQLTMGADRYTYDEAGNLVRSQRPGGTTGYRYDTLGRLFGVDLPDGRRVDYELDGLGRRVGIRIDGLLVGGFLYANELLPIAELDGSGAVVNRFVYSASGRVPEYLVRGGRNYALVTDQLGSVRAVVDTVSGAIAQRIDYDAFGVVQADTAPGFQPFGFAGGLADPLTGLVHFGAREYDPLTGRFTTLDPLGFAGGDTNLYRYALGDPVNRIDPTGTGEPSGGGEPTVGDPHPKGLPDTYGFTFGVNVGAGPFQFSAGWNVQHFAGNDWAVYNYIPAGAGSGYSFGAGLSGNVGWQQGEPAENVPGSWNGIFKTSGVGLGPGSFEQFKSDPEKPGWSGYSLGLGKGALPLSEYQNVTDYQCTIGCGSANGDPHIRTGDGLAYEFQAAGEFVAVEGAPGDLVIQIRTEPYGTSTVVSIVTAVALDVAGDRVSFYAGDATEVHIDGQPKQLTAAIALAHGGRVERSEAGYRVTWPDGSLVDVSAYLGRALDLIVDLAAARRDAVRGLLGDQDDDAANDLTTRDGRRLELPALSDARYADVVYRTFAESWRITAAESLFDYPAGASTASYTRPDFPTQIVTADTLDPDVRATAETICRRAGVFAPPFLGSCTLDVGLTGDGGFAASAARGQSRTIPPTSTHTYPIEIGDAVAPNRPTDGAGQLSEANEVDEYPFTAGAGRSWYLAAAKSCTDNGLRWNLVNPDGDSVLDALGGTDEPLCVDLGRFTAAEAGTYTVRVRAAGTTATGDYGFELTPVQADVRTTIAIGTTVRIDDPVPGAGRLSLPGSVHRFLFSASAGDSLYFETSGCAQGTLVWRLFGIDGKPIPAYREQTCLDLGRFDVPAAGTYTVVIGEGGPETGRYGFRLIRVGPDGAFTIEAGETIAVDQPGAGAGRIETPGSIDRYSFRAAAGDWISVVDLVTGAASCIDLRWDLLDPTGSSLYSDQILCEGAERPAIAAPASGLYTLQVRGDSAAVGTYGMRVTTTR